MKKISYSLHFGIIGSKECGKESGREILLDYLKKYAIDKNQSYVNGNGKGYFEFFMIFKQIPIKLRLFLAEDLNQFISKFKKIKNFDVIIFVLNLYDLESIHEYNKNDFDKFSENFQFKGLSILAALDIVKIFNGFCSKDFRISRESLIEKVKELNLIYCYEIQNKDDLLKFYDKIFNDLLFKFQFSSSELFEQAKTYGKELLVNRFPKKL